jgi:hypothetical protein
MWTVVTFAATYYDYISLREALEIGQVTVVEGIVTDFKPMPYEGHANERFCVQGNCFEYSDYGITAGFNNTSSHGGPIKNGLNVRVSFCDNEIARLEVRR